VLTPRGASFQKQWVTTGLKDESYWEILSGLHEGDSVIVGDTTITAGGKS
jgi:hypothetical protein